MRRLLPYAAALALGLLSAFAVACGGSDDESLLTAGRAEQLRDDLDAIERFVADGRCEAVSDRIDSLADQVNRLPRSTDSGLRQRLEDGVANLQRIGPDECRDNTETTDTTETVETVPPDTTETVPPETTEEPTPTTTQPPQTTTQPQQTTPQDEPTDPQLPGDSGGEQAPSGSLPPGQAKKQANG